MRNRNDKSSTGRTVAVAGGAALVLWLLLRGKGWGLGGRKRAETANTTEPVAPRPRCRVRVSGDGIGVDGARVDLPTAIERCRAVGTAEVRATGSAIGRVIGDVVLALQAAGIEVRADEDVWNTVVGRTAPRKAS